VLLFAALAFPARPGQKPVLLLVEDHRDTRQMYVAFLSSSFDVMEAADAEQALELIQKRRPDVIVTDLSLPGMNGFELIGRIRRNAITAEVPVISLSGYGGESHEQRAREVGCDRVLQKPCLPDALADTARELLRCGGKESDQA
jgi:DNA-binding response OmpR family regulator